MRVDYLHSGDNSRDNRHYYSHANQNLLLKWTLTRIRATIIPAIIVAIIAGIIAGIIVLLWALGLLSEVKLKYSDYQIPRQIDRTQILRHFCLYVYLNH